MSNFLKISTGIGKQAAVQGTDIASGAATSLQFLAANGSTGSAFRVLASADLPTITLTSDVTGSASAGSITATIAANAVTNSKLAQMAANTVKANITGSTANASDVTLTAAATATSVMSRDANVNTQVNAITENFATTATAAGTTTLTVSSAPLQQFTGSTTQTLVLPNATTLVNGFVYFVANRSTGVVTVNANGGGTLQAMATATQAWFTLASNGTSAGTWDISYTGAPSGGGGGSGMAAGGASTKSANYTIITGDAGKVFLAQSTGGAFNFTLPAASSGFVFTIKDSQGTFGTNNVTLVRAASESIEGVAASFVMSAAWGSWTFFCDGTNWFIIAH